ncbi:MAG: T9SS type A sorting domain-containing protein [Bacteroidales bacterium]|jgi:hypothetical protein|nr:T9SS type A sorting domain-containing protein [Bacteroidales bacterium]
MKRTLLTLALMFGAVSLMAQVNNITAQKQDLKIISASDIMKPVQKVNHSKAATNPVCDFNTPSEFNFADKTTGTDGHNAQGRHFRSYNNEDGGNFSTFISRLEDLFGTGYTEQTFIDRWGFTSLSNGFVYIDPIYASADVRQYRWNTYVEFTAPLSTNGMNVVILSFEQFFYKWNYDHCYIDWTTDPTWANYDSIEINGTVDGIISGEEIITLPVNAQSVYVGDGDNPPYLTSNPNGIEAANQNTLYIRFRYVAPAQENNYNGIVWIIDNVKYGEGNAEDLKLLSYGFYGGGYSIIPKGMKLDTLRYVAFVENSGANNINVTTEVKFHEWDGDSIYTYLNDNNISDPFNLQVERYIDTHYTAAQSIDYFSMSRDHRVIAFSNILPSQNTGWYATTSHIHYGTANTTINLNDTVRYVVRDSDYYFGNTDFMPTYHWAKAFPILQKSRYNNTWMSGLVGPSTYSDMVPNAFTSGYSTCISYTLNPTETGNWWANGISIVPAPDTCVAGSRIQGELKYLTVVNDALVVADVLDNNGDPVATEIYTVQQSDLNNGLFTDVTNTMNFNTIYLAFPEGKGCELLPDTKYFACYTLRSNSKFAVATDYEFSNWQTFGPQSYTYSKNYYMLTDQQVLTKTPGYSTDYNYWSERQCDNRTPMIGLLVSHQNNLRNVENTFGSLNMYPNPAKSSATLAYTLKNAGEVSIVVTDIMGREIVKLNEGKKAAGINYESTINTSNLVNGTYFYTISVNGAKQTNKFVVNK